MAQKLSYAERARKAQNLSSPTSSSSSAPTANIMNDPEPLSTPLPTESVMSMPPTKPVNVWSLRMEKMAARAAQKSVVNQVAEAAPTPSTTTPTSKSDNHPPDAKPKKSSSPPIVNAEKEDPFVVKMPQHLQHTQHSSTVTSALTEAKSMGQQSEQDGWPEVGKAISVSASSSSKSMSANSNAADDSSRSVHGNGANSSSNSPRKSTCSCFIFIDHMSQFVQPKDLNGSLYPS